MTAPRARGRLTAGAAALLAFGAARPAGAQAAPVLTLAPKRSLTLAPASACVGAPAPAGAARRDELAARREAARGRELALVGDRAGARAAFARALALDPSAAPVAYDLGRASEEAGDRRAALAAYCQLLALAPSAAEAADARARVARLAGPAAAGAADAERRAREAFARGVAAFDAARWDAAAQAFGEALRYAPNAPEASYDRGLAALAQGRDADAARDLAVYVASPSAGADRADVLRAVEALRRPRWRPDGALTRGLVPGFGQLYTGRPAVGVAVFAAAAAAVGAAAYQRTAVREVGFTDAFGNPYTSPVAARGRPYLAAGLGAGVLLTAAAALEARAFAARAERGRPVVRVRAGGVRGAGGGAGLGVVVAGQF